MEGGGLSKASSPEDSAARRAQECHLCRFCKRGFITAQALGGHMNVHRRREEEAPPAGAQVDGGRAGGSQKAGPGGNGEVDLELRLWF